ncbi:MAG: metal ABC transporter permease, partial [Opitutae bacterium]|nr:metal ABC transporter permease [Opitutae bacterium]
MKRLSQKFILIFFWFLFGSASLVHGEQIGRMAQSDWFENMMRFWTFEDTSMRVIVVGVLLIGINCGLMGGYIVTRRLSMFGDTLSHAVLPGIAVGFSLSQSRNDWALMSGAIVSGFLGVAAISFLTKYTKIKADSAMALILSSFYALGICLLTHLQQSSGSGVANLESYLFGSLVGLSHADLLPMVFCLLCVVLTLVGLRKEIIISGFDPTYACSIGLPLDWIQFLLSALLAFCIVTSLQTIGVVLVSALLIIPASTSWLLTHRLSHLLTLSALIGGL